MKIIKSLSVLCFICALCGVSFAEPPAGKKWKLVYEDNFNYPTSKLADDWVIMNERQPKMLCGRWKENAVVENGVLRLLNKKETRAGQDWTSASVWTKRRFKYGYFEARYRYAAASGVNNAFWVSTRQPLPADETRFEIDVNEGHWPDEIATNIHNWSDTWIDAGGAKRHRGWPQSFRMGKKTGSAGNSFNLDAAVPMEKIRISSNHPKFFRVAEIMAYASGNGGKYPDPMRPLKNQPDFEGLENIALGCKTDTSGVYYKSDTSVGERAVDGKLDTSWASQASGEKFIEVDFGGEKSVACVQFVTGWNNKGTWQGYISSYKIEYFSNGKWTTLTEVKEDAPDVDLSKDFHTYALEWNDKELVIYFDGREIRRFEQNFINFQAPVLFSAAIVEWAGEVTDKVDGTSMDVDYIKVWQEEGKEFVELPNNPK